MDKTNTHMRIFISQMMSEMLCTIYRTMLASCTSEAYHETRESSGRECLHMRVDNAIYVFQKTCYLTVILKEINHRLIPSSEFLIRFISSRIMN